MKITFKLSDIEIYIEDEKEQDRAKMIGEALGCVDALVNERLRMFGYATDETEQDEEDVAQVGGALQYPKDVIEPDVKKYMAAYT